VPGSFTFILLEVEWGEVKWSAVQGREEERVFMEKVYKSSKWWEVKDWGERVSVLVILKKTSTVLLGCFYLLYML